MYICIYINIYGCLLTISERKFTTHHKGSVEISLGVFIYFAIINLVTMEDSDNERICKSAVLFITSFK